MIKKLEARSAARTRHTVSGVSTYVAYFAFPRQMAKHRRFMGSHYWDEGVETNSETVVATAANTD